MDENFSCDYMGGASCTEVRARAVFAACDGVIGSSLRSSSNLTCSLVVTVLYPFNSVHSACEDDLGLRYVAYRRQGFQGPNIMRRDYYSIWLDWVCFIAICCI